MARRVLDATPDRPELRCEGAGRRERVNVESTAWADIIPAASEPRDPLAGM
jgi:hypothetical protein